MLAILGVSIAALADFIDSRTVKGGIMSAVIIGGSGALVGGVAANYILGQQVLSANFATVLLASLGALLIILVHRTAGVK